MSDTKRGRLGVAVLVADTDTTVYSITNSMDAVVDITFANNGDSETFIDCAIVDGLAADKVAEDYIEKNLKLAYGQAYTIQDVPMSDDEAVVAYAKHSGVTVRVSGTEEDQAGAGRAQELTASGVVSPGVTSIELNHVSVAIESTIADLSAHAGLLVIKNTSATGTEDHLVTAAIGTFDGTNDIVTIDALNECLVVWIDSAGNGTVVENVGTVGLSATA